MQPQQLGHIFLLLLPTNNIVHKALFQQELRPLKSLRKPLTDGLLDDARPCKPNQGTRLRKDRCGA